MNNVALYNTDLYLWRNQRESYLERPYGGPVLQVTEGMVSDGMQVLARFSDDRQAKKVLANAGFRKIGKDKYKA